MILSKNIKIKITTRNLKFYNKKGFNCKVDDIIDHPVNMLPLGSHIILDVECDYCDSIYYINYNNYNKKTKNGILPSCCDNVDCMKKKRILSTQEKYGINNVFQLKTVKDKIKETNLELYGVENPQQNISIKIKSGNTNLEKYGVINVFQSDEIKKKIVITNLKKYGVEYTMQSEVFKQKTRETNFKNYGFDYPIQNKEFYNKNLKNGFKLSYIDLLSCQGSYEKDFVLKYKDIIKIENGLSIEYRYLGEKKVYHSDFYLPYFDLVIEVKSLYWYNKNLEMCKAKEEYTKKTHNYIMILDKNYDIFDTIISLKKFGN